jgi:hypothetical protein
VLDLLCIVVIVAVWAFAWFPVIAQHRSLSTGVSRAIGVSAVDLGTLPPGFSEVPPLDAFRYDAGASAWALEPWFSTAITMYRNGEIPLWNPYQGFGAPLAANFQSAVFDPLLMVPIALFGVSTGQDISVLGMLLAGMVAAFAFARALCLRRPAAIVMAVGFGLNGFFLIGSNNEFCRAYAYIPIILLLLELAVRRGRAVWFAGLSIAIALSFYAGMPEITFLVLITVMAYAAWRVVVGQRVWTRFRTAICLGLAVVAGGLLAAPLLVPAAEYLSLSFNTHQGGGAASLTLPKWAILYFAEPFWAGTPLMSPEGVKGWVGVVICVLAVIGCFAPTRARRLVSVPFIAVFALVAGRAYGLLPLHWISSLPVVNGIIFDRWGQVIIAFCLVVMASVGVDAIARGVFSRRRLITAFGVIGILGVVTAWVIATIAHRSGSQWSGWQGANPLPLISAAAGDTHLYRLEIAIVTAGLVGVLLAVTFWGDALRWRGYSVRLGAIVAVLLVVLELGAYAHSAWPIYSQRGDALAAPGWVDATRKIAGDNSQQRVLGIDGKLTPGTPSAFGLSSIGAIDALYPERYIRYLKTFLDPTVVDRFTGYSNFWDSGAITNPMFQLTGTKWVVQQGFAADVPEKSIVLNKGAIAPVVWRDPTATIREIVPALPRAFLVDSTLVVSSQQEAADAITGGVQVGPDDKSGFNPRTEAVLEGQSATTRSTCKNAGTARITDYAPRTVVVATEARCPTYLVLTDLFYPGWQVSVNGVPVETLAADTAFRGVPVPAGASVVTFEYSPTSFKVGVWLAVSGLVLLLGLCFAVRHRGTFGH